MPSVPDVRATQAVVFGTVLGFGEEGSKLMGFFNSPVRILIKTESGQVISERLIPAGDKFTITLPDAFAREYGIVRQTGRGFVR
ncbi:hypothetical protein [Nocardia grenadensis]|uniref:hypothetical protein n=1 Tax=Nocardia grenadensis TaxID=931537 RepID=UPI003D72EF55